MLRPSASLSPHSTETDRSLDWRVAYFERRLQIAEMTGDEIGLRTLQVEFEAFLSSWHAGEQLLSLLPTRLPLSVAAECSPDKRVAILAQLSQIQQLKFRHEQDALCALANYVAGNFGEAELGYAHLARIAPLSANHELQWGLCLLRQGSWESALDRFTRAHDLESGDPISEAGKALALSSLGKDPEAMVLYKRSILLDPGHAEIHFLLGECLQRLGDHGSATLSYGRAMRLAPENATYRSRRQASFLECQRSAQDPEPGEEPDANTPYWRRSKRYRDGAKKARWSLRALLRSKRKRYFAACYLAFALGASWYLNRVASPPTADPLDQLSASPNAIDGEGLVLEPPPLRRGPDK